MTDGILVEFCGLPGAGKSTLAAGLAGALTGHGLLVRDGTASINPGVRSARRVPRKLRFTVTQGLTHPLVSLRIGAPIARAGRAGRERGPVDLAARFVQWTVTQRLFTVAQASRGIHVFEEGVVQALWSIGLRGDVSPVLTELTRRPGAWIKPDLVVVVDVPLKAAADRLRRRVSRHSRIQLLPGDEQMQELRHGESLLAELVEWFRDAPGSAGRVVRVSGAEDSTGTITLGLLPEQIVALAARLRPTNSGDAI